VAADALDFYLFKLVVPLRLYPDYTRAPEWLLTQSWRYLTVIPPLVLGVAIWNGRKRYPYLPVAACIFVLGVLPTLGLIPTYVQFASTVTDRYLYLAMLGPALLLASLLDRPRRLADGATAIALLVLGLPLLAAVGYWRDTRSLYSYNLAANPRSWISYVRLGIVLYNEGHVDEAIADYEASLRLHPNQVAVLDNLGDIHLQRHQLDAAQACFAAAVASRFVLRAVASKAGHVACRQRPGEQSNRNVHGPFLRDNPKSETVAYYLIQALMQQSRLNEAGATTGTGVAT